MSHRRGVEWRLERDRRGAVTLTSMNPNGFALTIRVYDRAGHVLVTAELRRDAYVGTTSLEHCIALGFEFDATDLPRVLRDVQDLVAFRCPAS